MPKTEQSPVLGQMSDVAGTSNTADAPNIPAPNDLDTRVTNLERAVNGILLQLADISEQLDPPSHQRETPPEKGKPKQQGKPKQKPPSPPPQQTQRDPEAQKAVEALADRIYELLSDGVTRKVDQICQEIECTRTDYNKARKHLIRTERMQKDQALVADEICQVPTGLAIWTQAQIDAELDRRKARDAARENEVSTDADEPSAGR